MKVAYIDHSLVVPVNRARITEFNRSTPHEMVGVAPCVWRDPQMGAAYRNASTPEVMFLHKIGPSHPVKHAYHPVQLIHALRSTRVMLVHANLEAYSLGARQLAWTCALLDLPLVLSVWQNQSHRRHEHLSRPVIQRCALMTGYTRQIAETWQSLVPIMPVLPWGIEAMAMGTPVIGSTCGAIPEVIGDAGLIFPDGDASALAAAITQLLSDHTTWQTLRERGHRRSLSYSWEHIAQESARLYEQVIEETAIRRRRG